MNFKVALTTFLMLLAPLAVAKPRAYNLVPIYPVGKEGTDIKVQFDIPCNASFEGFVVNPLASGTVTVNALLSVKPQGCSAMPRLTTRRLPSIAWNKFKKIKTLKPNEWMGRPVLTKTLESREVLKKKLKWVEVTYQTRCGVPFGFVLDETNAVITQVGFLELIKKSEGSDQCDSSLKVAKLPDQGISQRHLAPKSTDTVALEQQYRIRFATIERIQSSPRGGVEIVYQRRCNEAPVGVLNQPDRRATRLGMLVAYYYNLSCPSHGPQQMRDTYAHRFIHKNPAKPFMAMPASAETTALELRRPLRFSYMKRSQSQGLAVDSYDRCNGNLGLVIRPSEEGEPRIAVLTEKKASACKSPTKEISLKLEDFFNPAPTKKVRPLVLVGAA